MSDTFFEDTRKHYAKIYPSGAIVDYRAVLSIPCEPVRASVVGFWLEDSTTDIRLVIDMGESGYGAPHDRKRAIVWPEYLTSAD